MLLESAVAKMAPQQQCVVLARTVPKALGLRCDAETIGGHGQGDNWLSLRYPLDRDSCLRCQVGRDHGYQT